LAERLPQMVALLHEQLPALLDRVGGGDDPMVELQAMAARDAVELSSWLRSGLSRAGQGGAALAALLGTLALFPVLLFYAPPDIPRIGPALLALWPRQMQGTVVALAADADAGC
jgi:predicted PurR-regulated permease PerM